MEPGQWTPAPLSAHLSIECRCTAPQIDTPICTHPTTTHQFIWPQQHTCDALGGSPMECGVGGQPHKTRIFIPDTGTHPPEWPMTLPRRAWVRFNPPLHWCRAFPVLLVQMGYGFLCGLWMWRRRTNRWPCCPLVPNPSTFSLSAQPDGSGRWDNRMAAQHLPRDIVQPSSG